MAGKASKTGYEEDEARALVERGLERYSQGDVQAALVAWERALALDPGCEQARRHIDEVSRHQETLDLLSPVESQMDELFPLDSADAGPGAADLILAGSDPNEQTLADAMPGFGAGGGYAVEGGAAGGRAADTIEEGWPLVDELALSLAEPDHAGDLRAMAEELLGTARAGEAARAPARGRDHQPDTWSDEWTREPTIDGIAADAYSVALAPTVELVLPDLPERLFEGPEERDLDKPVDARAADTMDESLSAAPQAPQPAPRKAAATPARVPPVVIEEIPPRAQTGAHASPGLAGKPGGQPEARAPEVPDAAGTAHSPVAQHLLAALDAEVPASHERDDETLRRRVSWLIERAESECVNGDLEAATVALELALDEQPDSVVAQKLIHRHGATLLDIYERYIDNLAAVPVLAISPTALHEHAIDSRAAFLLSRIDGVLTVEDILDVSGMPPLEAYRYLCGLLRQGVLALG